MTPEYEKQADAGERQADDMEERSERLGDEIDDARQDWEAKKADPAVPGAVGDPERAEEGGSHPETAYPAKGSDEELSEADPAGDEARAGEEEAPEAEGDAGEPADEERGAEEAPEGGRG